ncbi:MAG TPA: methylated-DNA--[protein]-cysteine S-methyltransferase, partial [Candidatus Polarisedimenticolia bacterium]|nr:methylated-DNA--[protein]-cysteine S-methyltransferase [Candidatus Polarisedimenticolia bacterium]
RAIPYGSTRSYGEIGKSLGVSGAARAIGRACASNKVALMIPCHRAVAKGGGPLGYRWGSRRKKALLDLERAAVGPKRDD